ncbi:hypothetical protein [Stutzerimonas kirkiae]|uniref:hypothetical protein n=1 Tax=Stutzerimonas kirkiae TaxID=2211392 RepID=UPI00103834BF|nr:hypothetical protein [Stutzerimonas kirkiae]TBV12753.1 hypothetical protein DNK01_13790 [Stutzerimonas kirkiae]
MSAQHKRWDGLTVTDSLKVGVFYAGTRHTAFTLRVPMAGDLIAAQEEYPNGPLQLVTLDVYRRQLLALGDIPAEALTTDLLRAELAETDLALLADADVTLEKKLALPSAAAPTGDASSTPLSGPVTG